MVDLRNGSISATLRWHEAQVFGLAWTGSTIASGDSRGRLALWDVPAAGE